MDLPAKLVQKSQTFWRTAGGRSLFPSFSPIPVTPGAPLFTHYYQELTSLPACQNPLLSSTATHFTAPCHPSSPLSFLLLSCPVRGVLRRPVAHMPPNLANRNQRDPILRDASLGSWSSVLLLIFYCYTSRQYQPNSAMALKLVRRGPFTAIGHSLGTALVVI